MPRIAMDFSKTIIYRFVCQDETIICSYVGSTTNFVKRKNSHKSLCHKEGHKDYNLKLYKNIRDNGGWDNWKMIPLEEHPCENYIQQLIREQYWIDKLNPTLNNKKAFRTKEEEVWYQQQYDKANRDKINENQRKRRTNSKTIVDGDTSEPIHPN